MEGISLTPFVIYEWLNSREKNVYMFIGDSDGSAADTRALKKKYSDIKSVQNVWTVKDSIHITDTMETIRYKIANHRCEGEKNQRDCKTDTLNSMYMWVKSHFSSEDMLLFAQNVFKNEIKLKKSYLNQICKAYLGGGVYEGDDTDDTEMQHEFLQVLQAKKQRTIYKNVTFKYNTTNDFEVTLSPQPYVKLDEVTDSAAKTRFDKTILLKFKLKEKELHFVSTKTSSGIPSVYFSSPSKFDSDIDKLVRFKANIQNDFVDLTDVINNVDSKIDALFFRVLPLSHNLTINLKTMFKISETSYDMPIIVYKTKFTNEYKINKFALADMNKKQLDLFHAKELKQKEASINRANEVIIFYIKISPNNFFYFLLSSNGSYRLKYKSNKSNLLNMDAVKESFSMLSTIYKLVDNSLVYKLDKDTDVFNSSLIEVIDYNTQNLISFKTPILNQRVFQESMEKNNPFFDDFKKETKKVYTTQYIETNNFFNADTVSAFIYKNIELNKREMINKLKTIFQISEEVATETYEEKRNNIQLKYSKKGRNIFAVRTYHTSVYVRINLMSDYSVKVYTSNTHDIAYQTNILYLLSQYLTQNITQQKGVDKVRQQVMEQNPDVQPQEDSIQFNDLMANMNNDDNEDEFDFNDIDLDFGSPNVNIESDMDDFDIDLNDDVEFPDNVSEAPDLNEAPGNTEPPVTQPPQPSPNKGVKTNDYTTFVLNELYKADRDLFLWPTVDTKLKNYSSKCGAVNYRQPVVINTKEKAHIDKTQPDSYTGFVQTGSTEKLKTDNYYICPKIWCPISRVSLTHEAYEKYGNKCPPPHGETPLFFPKKGAKTNYFKKKDGTEPHWPALMNTNVHPSGMELPCCGKKEFVQHKPVAEDDDKKKRKSNYVSSIADDMILNASQFGNLPHTLNKILNNKAVCSGILDSKTKCFVRTGTSNTPNSLMEALSKSLGLENAGEHVLRTMKLEHFVFLNAGNTLKTYMDHERVFALFDQKEYDLFKTFFKTNKSYVEQFHLDDVLAYLDAHDSMHMSSYPNDTADSQKMAVIREYLIFQSFMNFRKFVASTEVGKAQNDVHHLFTFEHINTSKANVLFLEIKLDDVYFLNPIYFNFDRYYLPNSPSVVVLKINEHYEYISYISQLSSDGANISPEKILPIIQNVALPKMSAEERSLYHGDDLRAYVLSSGLKCVGYVQGDTIRYTKQHHKLCYDKLPVKSFVLIDRLEGYAKKHGLKGYVENEEVEMDLRLFMNTMNNTVEKHRSQQVYEEILHKIAKKMQSAQKLNDALHVLNHPLTNFTKAERVFLLQNILKQVKVKIPEEVNQKRLIHDLMHIPLSVIVDNYQLNNKETRDDEIVVNLNDINNLMLYEIKDQINKNPFKIIASSSEDMVEFIEFLKVETPVAPKGSSEASPQSRPPTFTLSINRLDIKPAKFAKVFRGFEVIDEALSFEKIINLFNHIDEKVTLTAFKERYTKRILKLSKNKDELIAAFKININSTMHKIGKRADINDFIGLVDRVNYHYSLFEMQIMAELANVNMIIFGRDTNMVEKGIRLEYNKSDRYVIFMYAINKTHHSFYVMVPKTPEHSEVRYTFAKNDFTPVLNESLMSLRKE